MRPHLFVSSFLFRALVFVTFAFIYFVLNWSIDIVMILCLIMVALAVIDFYMSIIIMLWYMDDLKYNQCNQCNQCIPFLTCSFTFISTMFLLCIFFFISLYYDDLSYSVSHVVYELGNEVKIEGKLTVLL